MDTDIACIAGLIGDKSRAAILVSLMNGKALTAGELARFANISPQTASNHLSKLLAAKLIVPVKSFSRYRYYRIASAQVAQALESLSLLADPSKQCLPGHNKLAKDIRFARTCYDHLAGELGVKITQKFVAQGYIQQLQDKFILTEKGQLYFNSLGINCKQLANLKRPLAKPCLDWTEREHHLAGSLGSALLDYLFDEHLIFCSKQKNRVVLLTAKGQMWLLNELKID
ncbi:MAG: transcriptional regulator [Gammaproteobacteria bacterium]|jgi:DNA-binding transcriptional ArsR family regulator|nr:transcriptional regulator [Gammaproteobacteria bacterium]